MKNGNSEKILNNILSNIFSRINSIVVLNTETKSKITEFVASKIEGYTKVEFLAEMPNAELEVVEFSLYNYANLKYIIQIAHETRSLKYYNLFYVVVKKAAIKETNKTIVNTEVSYSDNSLIRLGIISRIREFLKEQNLHLTEETNKQLADFLNFYVGGRVWVVFEEIPDSQEIHRLSITIKTYILNLAYGVNPDSDSKFPNILYVELTESKELKFEEFWKKNYLPNCLLNDALKLLDLNEEINVIVYERATQWRQAWGNSKTPPVFGQKIDSEGEFLIKHPIGFKENNSNAIVITSPNDHIDYSGACYKFLP